MNNAIQIISNKEVESILLGKELQIIELVRQCYAAHANGQSSLPFSTFLRFPTHEKNRIIGLPAYIHLGDKELAGMKWVASFPDNIRHNLNRASATLILNRITTGRPYAILEASHINTQRTAASAILAVQVMSRIDINSIAIVGCGPVNQDVLKYAKAAFPGLRTVHIYDVDEARSKIFAEKVKLHYPALHLDIFLDLKQAVKGQYLVSIATNTAVPYIKSPDLFEKECILLHISLRDLSPSVINKGWNIVDDLQHVDRENTSVDLTHRQLGGTEFVKASIGEILAGEVSPESAQGRIIYSPFGLGILDIAVGDFVYQEAARHNIGEQIDNFW